MSVNQAALLRARTRGRRVLVPNPDPNARRRQTRSAEENEEEQQDEVSFVFPAKMMDLNPRSRLDREISEEENVILPELPEEKGINYVFPFSPALKRESRQTETTTEEIQTTTPMKKKEEEEETETPSPATEKSETAAAPEGEGEDDEDYGDYEVSVSVSQSVSESFSVTKLMGDIANAITGTFMPGSEDKKEEESNSEETTTQEATGSPETTVASTTQSATSTTRRRHPFLSNKRKESSLVPRIHPVLAGKKVPIASAKPAGGVTRHPFFKQRTSLHTTAAPATTPDEEATTTEEIDGEDSTELPDDGVEIAGDAESEDEIATTSSPTSASGFLANKIKERLMKEALAKKAAEKEKADAAAAAASAASSGKINFLNNRNNRPKFQVPSSLRSRLQAKAKQAKAEDNEIEGDDEEESATTEGTTSTTRGRTTSRFRPPVWTARTTRPPLTRVTKPITRFTNASSTVSTSTVTEPSVSRSTSRFRSRLTRPKVSLPDLSTSPSHNVLSRGRSRSSLTRTSTATTTQAPPPSTTKLTVGAILAGLNGEQVEEEAPVTLRPKSFKPKFGSRQKDKVRQRLREQLEEEGEESADGDQEKNEESPSAPPPAPAPTASRATSSATGGRSRLSSRTRSRNVAPKPTSRVSETPRSSVSTTGSAQAGRNSLRSRSRSRLNLVRNSGSNQAPPTQPRRPITHQLSRASPPPPPPPPQPIEIEEVVPTGPARELSDADLMKGLGLAVSHPETTVPVVQPVAQTEAPPAPKTGDELLLQLVMNNQQQQEQQQQPAAASRPIMEDPSLIPQTTEGEELEVSDPSVLPAAFNPQDFLKTAVVESKLPPEVTAPPTKARKQQHKKVQDVPLVFNPQRETVVEEVEEDIYEERIPPPSRSRTRGRSRHRFATAAPARFEEEEEEVFATTSAPRTTAARKPVGRSRLRVRNRARTQAPAAPTAAAPAATTTQEAAPVSSRGRTRLANTRRRQPINRERTPQPAIPDEEELEEELNEILVDEEERNEVPLSQAPFGSRRQNLRTSSRSNSRVRVRNRHRGRQQQSAPEAAAPREEGSAAAAVREEERSSSTSQAVNSVNAVASSGRVRSRFLGKSRKQQQPQQQPQQPRVSGDHPVPSVTPTTISTTTGTTASDFTGGIQRSNNQEEEEEKATLRPGNFRPQFGSRQRVRDRLQQAREEASSQDSKHNQQQQEQQQQQQTAAATSRTEPPAFFKSVSPSVGVTALPASFFSSIGGGGVSPSSFGPVARSPAPGGSGIEVTTPRSSRVERSTLASLEDGDGPALGPLGAVANGLTTAPPYNRLGVSGHVFQDLEDGEIEITTPTNFHEDNSVEPLLVAATTVQPYVEKPVVVAKTKPAVPPKKKKKFGKKAPKIAKGLFGRKRPNFLKSLKDSAKADLSSKTGFNNKKLSALSKLEAIAAGVAQTTTVTAEQPGVSKKQEAIVTTSRPPREIPTTAKSAGGGFSLRPFKRPRRRLDVKGLKGLFAAGKKKTASTTTTTTTTSTTTPPFVPTAPPQKPIAPLQELEKEAEKVVASVGLSPSPPAEPSPPPKKKKQSKIPKIPLVSIKKSKLIKEKEEETEVVAGSNSGKDLLSKQLKKSAGIGISSKAGGGFLKSRLRNRFKYGRKKAASAAAGDILEDLTSTSSSSTSSSSTPESSSSSPSPSSSGGSQVRGRSHPPLPPFHSPRPRLRLPTTPSPTSFPHTPIHPKSPEPEILLLNQHRPKQIIRRYSYRALKLPLPPE